MDSKLEQFRVYAEALVRQAKAFGERAWRDAQADELRVLLGHAPADLSDAVLDDIDHRFLWGSDSALGSVRTAYAATLREARFAHVCRLLGLDPQTAQAGPDMWDAANGISRDVVRSAAEAEWAALQGDPEIEAFLGACARERAQRAQRAADEWLDVGGTKYRVLARAPVLWAGWESDDAAWVIEKHGRRVLVTTNHGELEEGNLAFLDAKQREYRDAIEATQALLASLHTA